MKATRALSAVAFLVSAAVVATSPAVARRGPHIVVEPVLSQLDDGRQTIRVSTANDLPKSIVIDAGAVEVFQMRPVPGRRGRRLASSPMFRYPCPPFVVARGTGSMTVSSSDGTMTVYSTPEPWPSPPPTPMETPMVVGPGANALSSPYTFGSESECRLETAGGAVGGNASPHVRAVYAVVTWHGEGSAKRSRIVSVVKRVDVPTTNARTEQTRGSHRRWRRPELE